MSGEALKLRCFCARHPLLGVCQRSETTGEYYLHVKVFKQGRIFGEVIATSGIVKVRCRECLRWHQVNLRRVSVDFVPDDLGNVDKV